ncbi:MAG: hypothetical protein C5B50_25615 [Verrucomicrobia bacterium]|nr:MAG: hypothetical protein C5B50_25615 [Verrucomicrobiota bacterium]
MKKPFQSEFGSFGGLRVIYTVGHESMRIPVHILVCYVIVGLSFVHATTEKDIARDLSLINPVGLAAIEWCPLALLLMYGLLARMTRKDSRRTAWLTAASAVVVLAIVGTYYPDWIVERYSEKIEIGSFVGDDMFLPPDEVRRFERAFETPTTQLVESGGGPWLIVPRAKYSPTMVVFLREEARRKAEPVQATAAALFVYIGPGDSLLPGFVMAQSPAAVPDLLRSTA